MSETIKNPRRQDNVRVLMKFLRWTSFIAVVVLSSAVWADGPGRLITGTEEEEEYQPGHSLHGGVFNEGPRQAAYLMEGMGDIDFPVTTNDPLTQKFVTQGVAQLHGFWFFEAERSFRQAAAIDPDCVMAYWGMTMANVMNKERFGKFLKETEKRARKQNITEREQLYVRSLHDLKLLAHIAQRYPEDLEAKAFLGIYPYYMAQMERSKPKGMEEADKYLEEVFKANPLHPAHHYRIHLWDTIDTPRGLDSASKVAYSAPGLAHMWHMAGHLYSLANRHREAAWFMEAALRLDHRYTIKDRVHPDVMHVYCHNAEWLIRCRAQMGFVHNAIDRCKDLIDLPRHPTYNNLDFETSSYYGRQRMFEILSEYELWDEMFRLADSHYLEPTRKFADRLQRHQYLATAFSRTGDLERAREELQALEKIRAESAEFAAGGDYGRVSMTDEAITKVRGQLAVADKLRRWDELSTGMWVGLAIGALVLLLGFWMLERTTLRVIYGLILLSGCGYGIYWLSGPASQIEDIAPMYRARDLMAYGQRAQAVQTARAYVEEHPNEVRPLAELAWMLWETGDKTGAKEQFEALRELSGGIDLDIPAFTRLEPLAQEFGYPTDWRLETPLPAVHADLPKLETLGPLSWHPSPAIDFSLPNLEGKQVSLADFRGKPVVLIFYLGYGCLHCVEQLHEFAAHTKELEEAGLTVIAVSTDEQSALKKAFADLKDKQFPFDLLADPDLEVFKEYRCYDDFEKLTLHGTFLIDADGMVRWQDIGYEPFTRVDFVIEEADRLLRRVEQKPVEN